MKVFEINNQYNASFNAHKIAKAKNTYKGVTSHLDIYQLKGQDKSFLEKMLNSISLKKLFPKISDEQVKTWQDLFRFGIFNAIENNSINYLAVYNNTPCGIVSYSRGKTFNIQNLVSIPIDINKKANLVGQTLLYQIFNDAKKVNAKKITLEAIKSSHGNPIEKYKQLGLKPVSVGNRYVEMECDLNNVTLQLDKLKNQINYKECAPKKCTLEDLLI